MMAIPETRRVH